jgi:hypothetical protein
LVVRSALPCAISVSRSIIQLAASISGAGECSAIGGASMPKSCSTRA